MKLNRARGYFIIVIDVDKVCRVNLMHLTSFGYRSIGAHASRWLAVSEEGE